LKAYDTLQIYGKLRELRKGPGFEPGVGAVVFALLEDSAKDFSLTFNQQVNSS